MSKRPESPQSVTIDASILKAHQQREVAAAHARCQTIAGYLSLCRLLVHKVQSAQRLERIDQMAWLRQVISIDAVLLAIKATEDRFDEPMRQAALLDPPLKALGTAGRPDRIPVDIAGAFIMCLVFRFDTTAMPTPMRHKLGAFDRLATDLDRVAAIDIEPLAAILKDEYLCPPEPSTMDIAEIQSVINCIDRMEARLAQPHQQPDAATAQQLFDSLPEYRQKLLGAIATFQGKEAPNFFIQAVSKRWGSYLEPWLGFRVFDDRGATVKHFDGRFVDPTQHKMNTNDQGRCESRLANFRRLPHSHPHANICVTNGSVELPCKLTTDANELRACRDDQTFAKFAESTPGNSGFRATPMLMDLIGKQKGFKPIHESFAALTQNTTHHNALPASATVHPADGACVNGTSRCTDSKSGAISGVPRADLRPARRVERQPA